MTNKINIKAIRNYDADYFVNQNGEECNNGDIKRYAIEIQNEAGDAIDYISENSENDATNKIDEINKSNKY